MNGGPISSPVAFSNASAVLEAWYGGYEAGHAIVDALFGAYSPAGRLPVTIVRDMDELPLYTGAINDLMCVRGGGGKLGSTSCVVRALWTCRGLVLTVSMSLCADTVLASPPGRTHRYYTGTPLYPFGFGTIRVAKPPQLTCLASVE